MLQTEMVTSYVAIVITAMSIVAFCGESGVRVVTLSREAEWSMATELVVGRCLLVYFLVSGLVYQFTRLGYLKRFSAPDAAVATELEPIDDGCAPSLAILIPSYKEEPSVVRQTLLAAALQRCARRSVVLLIDDPPDPKDPEDAARLEAMRSLVREIHALMAAGAHTFEQALAAFLQRQKGGLVAPRDEVELLAALWRQAADWLDALAENIVINNHNDVLFVDQILRAATRSHRVRALRLSSERNPASIDLLRDYRRLAALFKVEVTSFERKRYVNLSHEPNKAMNLNAYIGLMGRQLRECWSQDGRRLEDAEAARATMRIPHSEFIIVLDADSLIFPDYSSRLLYWITRPGHERVGVVQTPYASVPGGTSLLERIAGATTDVQLMSHQGSTMFGAGSWVGASALVRRAALDDIVVTGEERGYPIRSYIRDRTLNEDTDTTVDLLRQHWTVHNYPARLAVSATPPDFGSLLIQRRRWATGGLIILPNLLRYIVENFSSRRLFEGLIRAQYILSAPLGSLAIVTLMLYPFSPDAVWSVWPLPAYVAYIVTFGRDLLHNGNRPADVFRAMSLNAMLLPINVAGTIHSLQQLCTRRKIPFQRTPKVNGRTAAAPAHVAVQFGLLLFACAEVPSQLIVGQWLGGLFFTAYAAGFGYAVHAFLGWRAAAEDLFAVLQPTSRLRLLLARLELLNEDR